LFQALLSRLSNDCASAQCRTDGFTCVFVQIVSVKPLKVKDETGSLVLNLPKESEVFLRDVQYGGYCYVLLDTSKRPIRLTTQLPKWRILHSANYRNFVIALAKRFGMDNNDYHDFEAHLWGRG
uniref:KTSC domain-containing protein n=1 Tax=Gongylonema pulchrum TaxID=637853 RepID=A0A183DCW3_9BILA